MLNLENIKFSYPEGGPLLRGLSLHVPENGICALTGPNGAGKSTLFRIITGLLKPASGEITVDGQSLRELAPAERARMVAAVFQNRRTSYSFSVIQMVLMARHPYRASFFFDSETDREAAIDALSMVGLEKFAQRPYDTLSGGERQRADIAAALAQDTPVILFDEPTSFTDIKYKSMVYSLIRDIARQKKKTAVVITHDLNMVSAFCEKAALLSDGVIKYQGSPEKVFSEEILEEVFKISVKVVAAGEPRKKFVLPAV
ncbi:MAG: ABC transporter ATP-binding protein [Fibrobacterota bacterium]